MKFVPRPLSKTADASRGQPNIRTFLSGAAGALLLVGAIWLAIGIAADFAADSISEETEVALFGSWLLDEESEDNSIEQIKPILAKLLSHGDIRPLPIKLVLWDEVDPNAFAFPGGVIGITPSLLEEIKSEAGLAFVLAHELGHHHHRHTLKGVGRGILWGLTLAALGHTGAAEPLAFGLNLAFRARSRAQEREADDFAIKLVKKSYGSTHDALEFLELMNEKHSEFPSWGSFFSTHPPTPNRIQTLRALSE